MQQLAPQINQIVTKAIQYVTQFGGNAAHVAERATADICALPIPRPVNSVREARNLNDPHFAGDTYEKEIDQKALKGDFFKVLDFMATHEGQYFTDPEIADATGVYIPSVQRMRCYMKQTEWGAHLMLRRRREGQRLFEFSCIPNKESVSYKALMHDKSLPKDNVNIF